MTSVVPEMVKVTTYEEKDFVDCDEATQKGWRIKDQRGPSDNPYCLVDV